MVCGQVLSGEYMGKDGQPYCEKDYQKSFGVKCAYCERYISGKVLQAGDNHHFHPTCARCSKCGDPFGDGEEMYLQGTAIWVSYEFFDHLGVSTEIQMLGSTDMLKSDQMLTFSPKKTLY
jgi:hypothetical protein